MAEENENINIGGNNAVNDAGAIKDSIVGIRSAVKEANAELEKFGEMQANITSEFGEMQAGANKVASIQREAATSSKATEKAITEQKKQQDVVAKLNERINNYLKKAETLTGSARDAVLEQAQNLATARDGAQSLADTFGNIADDAAKLDKRTSFFDAFGDLAANSKVFKQFASPFRDAAKAARETVISNQKTGKSVSVIGAGMKGFAASAAKSALNFFKSGGYIGVIAGGLKMAVKFMLDIDKATSQTAKALDISKKEAAAFAFNAMAGAKNVDYTAERINAATIQASAFANQFGISNQNADVMNHSLDSMTVKLGLSQEQTSELALGLIATGQNAESFRNEMLGTLAIQKEQSKAGVTTKALMKDIAGASSAFKVNSGMSAKELGKAAVQARKTGLTFAQLESISDNLLDFESSIQNEMTAQMMTGKAINLDKARLAAMNGDLATVAQEISKQEAVQEAFATKNVLAQQAVADSLGISRNELADMFQKQQALEKSGFKSEEARQKEFERLKGIHGEAKALEMIGDKEFTRITKQASFQEKINMLIENMKHIFTTAIAPAVEEIMGKLSPTVVNDLVEKVKDFATQLLSPDGTLTNMKANFMGVYNTIKGIGLIIKAVLVNPLAAAYHTVAATVAGLQEAYYYTTLQFDKAKEAGKAQEKHSALAVANVVDVGTNIIKGGALLGGNEELGNAKTMTDMVNDAYDGGLPVKDFVLKPLAEDTITMAGGTKLGGNVEVLLKELIDTVKSGGDVYLDGSKVGQSLVMNAKLSN